MPRITDTSILHLAFRERVRGLANDCDNAAIPLSVYETGRTPQRQVELYARGRGDGETGKTATRAKAWESLHQYLLAADFVFFVDGRWTWTEPRPGMWAKFTELARGRGLRPLSFERPHVELPVSLAALKAGQYPGDGGATWEDWIETQIENWGREPRTFDGIIHPGAPPLPTLNERPPLEFPEGLPPSPFGA